MRTLSLGCLLALTTCFSNAQESQKCGADELRINTLREMPKVAEAVIKRNLQLEHFTSEFATNRGGEPQVYVIPVVFHVIHQYGNENISDAQLMDGLRVCNATFRKTSPDTAIIVDDFKPIHADCGIEFRLATKDPEGNCHSGINRIASSLGATGDHAVKSLVHWDPTKYLNVYVTSNAAGLAGHAVWPADADTIPEWDGIVIAHNYVGAIGTSTLTRSVVFAHECGHYLNLHHIWGGNNVPEFYYLPVAQSENCEHDDLVGDTPNTIGFQNCNLNAASCGNTVDNVQNAMDYSYCNIMFTEGQAIRMRACLNSPIAGRNNLWQTSNLIATGVLPEPAPLCAADMMADRNVICANADNEVTYTSTAFHGALDSLQWDFPGGTPASSDEENPTVTYTVPGIYDVVLRAYQNGEMAEVTKAGFITVISDVQVPFPFSESFEEAPDMDMFWSRGSSDGAKRWLLTDDAASTGDWSATADHWETTAYTKDELYSPRIDLTGASEMKVAFRYAFSGHQEPTGTDRLQFHISRDCEPNWTTRLSVGGNSLLTAPVQTAPFVPQSNEWIQETINIPSSYLEAGFRFRFVFTSGGGNRLFIDDINIDIAAHISEAHVLEGVEIFPNPAGERIAIRVETQNTIKAQLSITDPLGRSVLDGGQQTFGNGETTHYLNINDVVNGLYLLSITTDTGRFAKLFMVQH